MRRSAASQLSTSSQPLLHSRSRSGRPQEAQPHKRSAERGTVNGIAIVRPGLDADVSGCLRVRKDQRSLEDTLSLVNGQEPTFLSYACRQHRNKRQEEAHNRRIYLKSCGCDVPAHKCAERKRLEAEGGILIMDGYLNRHMDTAVADASSGYRVHFESRPPGPDVNARPRERLSKMTRYLVDEAVRGHRPIFERIPTTEVYGEGYEYTVSAEPVATTDVFAPDLPEKNASSSIVTAHTREGENTNDGGLPLSGSSSETDSWSEPTPSPKGFHPPVHPLGHLIEVCV